MGWPAIRLTGLGIWKEGWPYHFKHFSANGQWKNLLGKHPQSKTITTKPKSTPHSANCQTAMKRIPVFFGSWKTAPQVSFEKCVLKELKHFNSFPKINTLLGTKISPFRGMLSRWYSELPFRWDMWSVPWRVLLISCKFAGICDHVLRCLVGHPTQVSRAISWAVDQGAFQRIFHRVVSLEAAKRRNSYRWQILQYIQYISTKTINM